MKAAQVARAASASAAIADTFDGHAGTEGEPEPKPKPKSEDAIGRFASDGSDVPLSFYID